MRALKGDGSLENASNTPLPDGGRRIRSIAKRIMYRRQEGDDRQKAENDRILLSAVQPFRAVRISGLDDLFSLYCILSGWLYRKNTITTFSTMSVAKWEAIALSSPYRQYSQPKRIPMIPFRMSVLETVAKSTGMPMITMLEM